MVQKELIIENFKDLGYDVDDEVANRCLQLCNQYNIDESSLVDTWVAFSMSGAEDAQPNADSLALMEKKKLSKISGSTPVTSRNSTRWQDEPDDEWGHNNSTPMITEDYEAESERGQNHESIKTPKSLISHFKNGGDVPRRFAVASPRSLFSPASFSPEATAPSKKYSERTNSGDILSRFGSRCDSDSWGTTIYSPVNVDLANDFLHIPNNARFMFETSGTRIIACRKLADTVCFDIMDNYEITKGVTDPYGICMDTTTYAGRIMCDSSTGKLNTSSILLDSCVHPGIKEHVQLEVSDLPEYSLFPGQVVVIEGTNPTGRKIIAEKLYADVKLPYCPAPPAFLKPREPLQVVVAAGPYTLSDTLSYQPWEDLSDYVIKNKPHVLILIGPIIDCLHPLVANNSIFEPFPVFFERQLLHLLNRLQDQTSKTHTKVVLVSSWREAGQMGVYPTPRIDTNIDHPNLFLAPDPCILHVDGFQIGITSADILMHLAKEEIFCSATGTGADRLGRLASHLLQQRNFYPLVPSAEEMSIDMDLFIKHGVLPYVPHMLILPSDFKHFIKNIKNCIVVNSERLAKGQVGGTFARIEVTAATEDVVWAPESHVSAQIVRI